MVVEKFIKAIKRPRLVLSVLLERTAGWWSDRTYLKWHYRLSLGRKLNLDNPITFNEKLQWLKLYNRKPEYTIMVDKVKVKEYVAEKIGDKYIIPTIAVWDSADEIDWDVLPSQFVMKCSHDSGGIIICKDKSKLDKKKAISIMSKGLKRRYFKQNREWPYKDVTPRIIVEAYMVDESGYELKDEFDKYNAKIVYKDILPTHEVKENKACKCPEILKGVAKPTDCKIFGTVCTPTNPIGSCMVSSEGACSAYYKYGNLL